MIKPLIKPMIKPLIKSMIAGASRWFTKLNGASYYAIPTAEMSGDYSFSVDVVVKSLASTVRVWGNSANFNNRLSINTDGSMNFRDTDSSNSIVSATGVISVGVPYSITCSRVGGVSSIVVNGGSVASGTSAAGTTSINRFGEQSGLVTDEVYVYNAKISGITNTGTYPSGTASWAFDEQGSSNGYTYNDGDNAGSSTNAQGFNIAPEDEFFGSSPE